MAIPTPDPFEWARMFARDASGMRDASLAHNDNALMNIFREEAARQRPYATMPAELAMRNIDRQNALPYEQAAGAQEFDRWKEQRRFQQQLDIEEAIAIANGGGALPGDGVMNINGVNIRMPRPQVPPEEQ